MSLLEMSFSGAFMIIAIVIVRALAVNRLPKRTFLILWELVLLRLLVPFSIPSVLSAYSLINRNMPVRNVVPEAPVADTIPQEAAVPVKIYEGVAPAMQNEGPDISIWLIVWMVGMLLCAGYFLISYFRCRREFQTSLPVRNEYVNEWLKQHQLKRTIKIRKSDRISAPLTYGVISPVILLPKKTDWENRHQLQYVLMHEYIHIRRFDAVYKLVATLALCIHWFNPLVWTMYILYNRDIELACDENVVRQFGDGSKSTYARTLITMEETRSGLTPLYNNFSKNAIEERITAIMKTKKLTIGLITVSAVVIIAIVVLFATSAESENVSNNSEVGIVGDSVETSGTVLEMAKEFVSEKYEEMQGSGYSNWKIDTLEHTYTYEDLEGMNVQIYQLNYAFLAEDPEKVMLAGGMTMDEDGWVVPEYANCTFLAIVQDRSAPSYQILVENDCFPGDEVFTADLKTALNIEDSQDTSEDNSSQISETEADHYMMATSLSVDQVEQYAMDIKSDILTKDWEALSGKIAYPISLSGITVNNSTEFLSLDMNAMLSQEFVDAIDAETCRSMFCNWQGVSMGAAGQIWFAGVDNGNGVFELKIIGMNGMLEAAEI